jgi:molybdopterin molybdotransferase
MSADSPERAHTGGPVEVDQAIRLIREAIRPVEDIAQVSLAASCARVLAQDLIAPRDIPEHDNAAMDGYAIRASDVEQSGGVGLRVAGRATAGHPYVGPVDPGCAVRVMTGAVIPPGADTVVQQELAELRDGQLYLPLDIPGGANLRRRGEDLRAGSLALAAGRRLRPIDLGLIATLGTATVAVRRRPRVALLSTGDELRPAGDRLADGQRYDSNGPALAALLSAAGMEVHLIGAVLDDRAGLERLLEGAGQDVDAIVSTGGVSVGEADFTRPVLARLGSIVFEEVNMRPGRPMTFGRLGKALYFGLPGNPVAAMVAFEVLVRDALCVLAGETPSALRHFKARCAVPLRRRPGRSEFPRARLSRDADGFPLVTPLAHQGTGALPPLVDADCLMWLGPDQGSLDAGDPVDCLPLGRV